METVEANFGIPTIDANFGISTIEASGIEGGSKLQRLLDTFLGPGGDVGIWRLGDAYWMLNPIGGGMYAAGHLRDSTVAGKTIKRLDSIYAKYPAVSIGHADSSVVKAGVFTTGNTPLAFSGSYTVSLLAGETVTITTPAAGIVGLRTVKATNGGLSTVSIDGNLTAATLLPTAQELVTAGTFPATILTTGGGTILPSTRVLDYYDLLDYDVMVMLALGLAEAAHTIVVTNSGYKRAESAETRLYLTGYMYGSETTALDDPSIEITTAKLICPSTSFEYALTIKPTGGVGYTTIGNSHGYDSQISLTFILDGETVTLTDGEIKAGKTLVIRRESQLYHPSTGDTVLANVSTVYTADSVNGILIDWSIVWLVGGLCSISYVGMMSYHETLNYCANVALPGYDTLDRHDDSFRVDARSAAVYAWDGGRNWAGLLYTPSTKNVANWANNPLNPMCVQDNAAGIRNKAYQHRIKGVNTPYAAGDVWTGREHILIKCSASGLSLPVE